MRTFQKSDRLDHVSYEVRGPVVAEADRMIAAGTDVLKLNIGNPAPFGFRAPEQVVIDMQKILSESEGYSDSKGLIQSRMAIAEYYTKYKHVEGVTPDDIYIGNGASEMITLAMQALLNPGDEMLIPAPDYPLWTASVNFSGGKAVHYICDEESDWMPDLADMESKITDRTKGIVIINPNNPTGAFYSDDLLMRICEIARRHDLIIFADEIYDRLLMDGLKHTSIASLCPDLFCVTFCGLSKSHYVCGFRSGWMVLCGNKKNVQGYIEGITLLSSMRLCANVPGQAVIPTALADGIEVSYNLKPGGRIYEQRDVIYNALNDIPGVSVVRPKAAFYIFPKLDMKKFNLTDDVKFTLDFLKQQHVLVIAGSGFNWPEPNHFRIVYLPEATVLKESMDRLKTFLADYRQ